VAEEVTGQERTEPATPKRREDARRKGQVAKSRELPAAAGILAGALFFLVGGGAMIGGAGDQMHDLLAGVVRADLTPRELSGVLLSAARGAITLLLPLMMVMLVMGVAVNVLQTGPVASLHPLAPKWSRISPAAGVKRIFSAATLVELIKSVIKLLTVGTAAWWVLKGEAPRLPALAGADLHVLLPYLGGVSLRVALAAGVALLFLAALDFGFQRFEHEKRLRMTRQEVKREFKETEGDPMVRARVRSIQRETARKRMMADVPKADVVVTNPTHLAVALKYEAEKMAAPRVVAKGAGHVAARIREIARGAGVPVMEDKPLARALYRTVEVGREVPADLYRAVAEVLAFVYLMNEARRGGSRVGGARRAAT
jgi:flagellar biosynthetic protein FlhB